MNCLHRNALFSNPEVRFIWERAKVRPTLPVNEDVFFMENIHEEGSMHCNYRDEWFLNHNGDLISLGIFKGKYIRKE